MLTIEDHHLRGSIAGKEVGSRSSPNCRGTILPRLLVFHYTACSFDVASSVFMSTTGDNRVSAHLLVDVNGAITQFVPFTVRAWHAGESQWGELTDINTHSIGIEVVNYGYLLKSATGQYRLGNGKPLPFSPDDAVEVRHKNPAMPWTYWQAYTPEQIETCQALADLLVANYHLTDIVGHDDIAPKRKCDPGPAFPLLSIRGRALGRESEGNVDGAVLHV